MELHHIGYIVPNAEDPSEINPGLRLIGSVIDPLQEAKICLYKNQQDELIELIQPLNEKSPVWNFLKKNGMGFHHHCYSCSVEEMVNYAKTNELVKIRGPIDAALFPDKKVIFYITKSEAITEFILE